MHLLKIGSGLERVVAFRFGFEAIAQKVFLPKKRKISQVIPEEEHCNEKWSKPGVLKCFQ